MANSFTYKNQSFNIGSTVKITYKFREGEKERRQVFQGILIQIKGATPATKMITVRKNTRSNIGVERIIPLSSPFLEDITLFKKSSPGKAKLYFIRGLPEHQVKHKLK